MGGTKVLAAMLVAASFWAANAGKCKPHPNQTSLLTIASDISTAASSATNSDVRSSTRSIEATESVDAESKTSGNSPVTISYQSTTSGPLDPTTSSANLIVFTTSIDSTVSSYEGTPRDSTTNEITTSTETASTDTIKSDEQATTTDTTTWAESTTLTDTTVTTDTATTLVTSVSASESTTTESFRSSATEESCPIISSSLEDPGFERDNSGTNQWEYMLAFSGVPVPFQRKSSTSQDVPRANSVDQFALLSSGTGSTVGSDMWRPLSLDPTKKYQVWFSFAPVSSPDEDWSVGFQISTRVYGPVYKETIAVSKGAPFKYIHGTAIFQGAAGDTDHLYAILRASSASVTPRLAAVDDVYVAEYKPSCTIPTEPTDLCGGTQGYVATPTTTYRQIQMNQGSVQMCAQACLSDENCIVFGWVVEQYFRNCYLSRIQKEDMKISVRTDGRGMRFYDRSCGQCSGLECPPYFSST